MTADAAGNASFTAAFSVDQTPGEVFHAINNVRGWWSEDIKGGNERVGDEFSYLYQDVHRCRIKVIALVPGERVAWRVLDFLGLLPLHQPARPDPHGSWAAQSQRASRIRLIRRNHRFTSWRKHR